ncbi:importin-alpha export receptor, partial [Kappamyces sp. JEL0680]
MKGTTPAKLAENDYLMKCVLRVVVCSRGDLIPHAPLVLERLTYIIREISKNPSNPKFNYFTFETLSALVKYVCVAQPALVQNFENSLMWPFQEILAHDVLEFTPYVFQVLSQLLALHTEDGIPATYLTLLQPLLQPSQWENHANIPALVNFLSSFLSKSYKTIIQQGQFPAFLGIFQKLVSSRLNDHHGMNFLKAIFEYVPSDELAPYAKNLFVLMMQRIFQSKT